MAYLAYLLWEKNLSTNSLRTISLSTILLRTISLPTNLLRAMSPPIYLQRAINLPAYLLLAISPVPTYLLRAIRPGLSATTTSLPSRFIVVGGIPSLLSLTLPMGNVQGSTSTFQPCFEYIWCSVVCVAELNLESWKTTGNFKMLRNNLDESYVGTGLWDDIEPVHYFKPSQEHLPMSM